MIKCPVIKNQNKITGMFEADRTFYIVNEKNGNAEWYFQAREGNCGPYESKQDALLMLQEFIKENIETGNSGGRNSKEVQPSLNLTVRSFFRAVRKIGAVY